MQRIKNFKLLISFIALSLLLAGMFNFSMAPAEAVPVNPEVYTHVQQDGTVVYYRGHGDEFLNYMTDSNGDLVAFAQDGDLYLARWADKDSADYHSTIPTSTKIVGAVRGSRVPSIESMRPLKSIIPQHHLQRAQKMRDERDSRWREQFKNSSAGRQLPTRGVTERKVLMIYVSFAYNGGIPSMNVTKPTSSTLYNMMFNEYNWGTVAHYYKTVTNNSVSIKPAVTINTANQGIIFVQLSGPHGNWGLPSQQDPRIINQLVVPALRQAANSSNPGGYVNYAAFDKNGDGNIKPDELSVGLIVHGYETNGVINANYPSTWAHKWEFTPQNINGVYLSEYFAQGAFQTRTSNPQLLTIGVIAHELGHDAFGFIDLYQENASSSSDGVGEWSLMGGGNHAGIPAGSSPTAIDAFHLYGGNTGLQLAAPRSVSLGSNTLSGLTQYVKLETKNQNQYFLIQPRGYVGYDRGLLDGNSWSKSSGLLFLLVDESVPDNDLNSPYNHYRVAVVPAGWTYSSSLYKTTGNPIDLFSAYKSISYTTLPSSKIYAGTGNAYPTLPSEWSIDSMTSSVTGAGTNYGTANGSFYVTKRPLIINTTSLSNGKVGEYYYQTLSAIGSSLTWLRYSGSLPPGLSISSSGFISGTPTATGTFNFVIQVINTQIGEYTTKDLSITIDPATPINITTTSLPASQVGMSYHHSFGATGGGAITWSIISGSLPPGLNVINNSGLIYGTPTTAGTYYFTVLAANAWASAQKFLSIVVSPAYAPTINTTSLPGGTAGANYSQTLSASGTAPITWSVYSGSLPTGLNLYSSGSISGIPTTAGTYYFTVKAQNYMGSATRGFSVNIAPGSSGNVPLTGGYIETGGTIIYDGDWLGPTHVHTYLRFVPTPANATITSIEWESDLIPILSPYNIETPIDDFTYSGEYNYTTVTVNGTHTIGFEIYEQSPQ